MARRTKIGYDAWAVEVRRLQLSEEEKGQLASDPRAALSNLAAAGGEAVNGVLIDWSDTGPAAEMFSEWHVVSGTHKSKKVYIKEV
jgi:hypothetical protein